MPLTVSELISRMPEAFIPEKAHGVKAIIHFKFTGAEAGEWTANIADGKCETSSGAPADKATLVLTADSADYIKLITGELDGMQAFMQGKLKLGGDLNLAMKMMGMFKIK